MTHTSSGDAALAWMLSYAGDIKAGSNAPKGGYAIRKSSVDPILSAGQAFSFQISIGDGSPSGNHYDVDCVVIGLQGMHWQVHKHSAPRPSRIAHL